MTIASILVIAAFAVLGAAVAYGAVVLIPRAVVHFRTRQAPKVEPPLIAQRPTAPAPLPVDGAAVLDGLADVRRGLSDLAQVQMGILETPAPGNAADTQGLAAEVADLKADISGRLGDVAQVLEAALNRADPPAAGDLISALTPALEQIQAEVSAQYDRLSNLVVSPQDTVAMAAQLKDLLEAQSAENAERFAATSAATAECILLAQTQREEALQAQVAGLEQRLADLDTHVARAAAPEPPEAVMKRFAALEALVTQGLDTLNAKATAVLAAPAPTVNLTKVEAGLAALADRFDGIEGQMSAPQKPGETEFLRDRLEDIASAIEALSERAEEVVEGNDDPATPDEAAPAEGSKDNVVTLPETPADADDGAAADDDLPRSRLARDMEVLRAYPGLAAMLSRGVARQDVPTATPAPDASQAGAEPTLGDIPVGGRADKMM